MSQEVGSNGVTNEANIKFGIHLLRIHDDATADLKAIKASDPVAFGRLFALLQELKGNKAWQDRLLEHNFGADRTGAISIMKWLGVLKRERVPLWRIKFWNLENSGLKYRILYIYDYHDQSYNVMAVVERGSFDYDDPNDPIRKRIIARCRVEFPNA